MPALATTTEKPWWSHRATVLLLVFFSMLPLMYPSIPTLVDLPGHMGRYAVELEPAPYRDWYDFRWQLIGNLGIDLLIVPVSKIFGLELGTKLIVMAIPALTVAGLLWIAREVHGHVPPTAFFALPLAYGHPFIFGFVNFALSMALALCAFALWLRLARFRHFRLRAGLFLLIGPALWLTHTFGWATLCVLAFSAETVRQHDHKNAWPIAMFKAGLHCLSLAPPMVLMIAWRSGHVGGSTGDWFNWSKKLDWLLMTLRDRWKLFDLVSLGVIGVLIAAGLGLWKYFALSRNLVASAVCLLAVFLLLPRIVFGSAYADMRLTPFMIAMAVIAIRPREGTGTRFAGTIAMLGLTFFATRTLATTASFAMLSTQYDRALVALDHLPPHARLVSFVGFSCKRQWFTNRMEHLPAVALARRSAYTNDQWNMAGAQLLTLRLRTNGRFSGDPSQIVTARPCRGEHWQTIDWSLANLPRDVFDYVWLIDVPPYDPQNLHGLTQVWRDGPYALYRVDKPILTEHP